MLALITGLAKSTAQDGTRFSPRSRKPNALLAAAGTMLLAIASATAQHDVTIGPVPMVAVGDSVAVTATCSCGNDCYLNWDMTDWDFLDLDEEQPAESAESENDISVSGTAKSGGTWEIRAKCHESSATKELTILEVESLTVWDKHHNWVQKTNPSDTSICIARKVTGGATIDFDAAIQPSSARNRVMWMLEFADPANNKDGTFLTQPGWSQVIGEDCTLRVGFDRNGNGVLTSSEVLCAMSIELVYLAVSGVDILLSDGTYTPFVASGSSNEFDPFYDDALVGGIANFSLRENLCWAEPISYSNADLAATNTHAAEIEFCVTADAKARMTVYLNRCWPASDVIVEPATTVDVKKGVNRQPFWNVDDEQVGEYVAYVGVYLGSASSSNADYCEDGMHPTEEPISPRAMSTGRACSPGFSIRRRGWGAVHNVTEVASCPTGTLTVADWANADAGQYIGSQVVALLVGYGLAQSNWLTAIAAIWGGGHLYLDKVDLVNGASPSTGPPVGWLVGDSCHLIEWRDSRRSWDASTSEYVLDGSESKTVAYVDMRRPGGSVGLSYLDYFEIANDTGGLLDRNMSYIENCAKVTTGRYIWPAFWLSQDQVYVSPDPSLPPFPPGP